MLLFGRVLQGAYTIQRTMLGDSNVGNTASCSHRSFRLNFSSPFRSLTRDSRIPSEDESEVSEDRYDGADHSSSFGGRRSCCYHVRYSNNTLNEAERYSITISVEVLCVCKACVFETDDLPCVCKLSWFGGMCLIADIFTQRTKRSNAERNTSGI